MIDILSYLQGFTQAETLLLVHKFSRFSSNPTLVHEHAVSSIAKYLASIYMYMSLLDGNSRFPPMGSYIILKINYIEFYVGADFDSSWDQLYFDDVENFMPCTGWLQTTLYTRVLVNVTKWMKNHPF